MSDSGLRLSPRQELLLKFLGSGENSELDPIRVMKGAFLISMEAPEDWFPPEARYEFFPYNYGPFAPEVYQDLETLAILGYVEMHQKPGRNWNYYLLTPAGQALASDLLRRTPSPVAGYLRSIREFVGRGTLRALLAAVYNKYPEYARNSVFQF